MRYWRWAQSNTHRAGCNGMAEPLPAADALQPPLRCGFRARLRRSVTLKTILRRGRGQGFEMDVIAQALNAPCEAIYDVLMLMFIEVVGPQLAIRFVTG
jgi:hypothetical protein